MLFVPLYINGCLQLLNGLATSNHIGVWPRPCRALAEYYSPGNLGQSLGDRELLILQNLWYLNSLPASPLNHLCVFLNAHLIMLSVSLNVLLIILLISLSICIFNILRKPSPKPENTEWQGVWRVLEETLETWTSSVSCDFTPEHLQDPDSLGRYLRQGCYGSGRYDEALIIWGLANDYRALFNTNPESESF